jgi:hypothetical protein
MPPVKEQLVEDIKNCHGASLNEHEIARKMFILDPAFVFKDNKILGFRILNSVAEKFRVPLACVKIAGSAQIGFSSTKNRDFILGVRHGHGVNVAVRALAVIGFVGDPGLLVPIRGEDALAARALEGEPEAANAAEQIYKSGW